MQVSNPNAWLESAQKNHPQLPLAFSKPLLVVGAGSVDVELLNTLAEQDFNVVAADGGANHCADIGLVPDAIIGDMDSLNSGHKWPQSCERIEIAEQETTDFEKCLYATRSPFVVALGMVGNRLDHTLATFDVAARYAAGRPIIFVGGEDVAIAVSGPYAMENLPNSRLSVHPLQSVWFARSEGLEYPLAGLHLAPGLRTGTSNRTLNGQVKILPATDDSGTYMVILDAGELSNVIEQMREILPKKLTLT